jgi:hypothetical protein
MYTYMCNQDSSGSAMLLCQVRDFARADFVNQFEMNPGEKVSTNLKLLKKQLPKEVQ